MNMKGDFRQPARLARKREGVICLKWETFGENDPITTLIYKVS